MSNKDTQFTSENQQERQFKKEINKMMLKDCDCGSRSEFVLFDTQNHFKPVGVLCNKCAGFSRSHNIH